MTLDSVLSEAALHCLEMAQVPVVTALAKVPAEQLTEAIGLPHGGFEWEFAIYWWKSVLGIRRPLVPQPGGHYMRC